MANHVTVLCDGQWITGEQVKPEDAEALFKDVGSSLRCAREDLLALRNCHVNGVAFEEVLFLRRSAIAAVKRKDPLT